MTGGRVLGVVAAVALVVSACGDPAVDRPAAADTAAAAAIPADTDVAVVVEGTVVNADGTPPPTVYSVQPTAPTSSLPLGGVAIDDPLPTQADSTADPAAAEVGVRYAYSHFLLVDLDKNVRGHIVENGEANVDALDNGLKAARGVIEYGRIAVDEVVFLDPEHAQVSFRVRWQDGPSPYFPNEMSGTALFAEGTWRISGRTLCLLAFGAGQDCAGVGPNPTPPVALEAKAVPAGWIYQGGSATPNVLGVPGQASWYLNAQALSVTTDVLTGISAIDAGDLAQVLASGRFGGVGGDAVMVGDRPGRLRANGDGISLVFVRADDVIVQVNANGLTSDEIIAFAASLVPSTVLPAAIDAPDGNVGTATTTVQ